MKRLTVFSAVFLLAATGCAKSREAVPEAAPATMEVAGEPRGVAGQPSSPAGPAVVRKLVKTVDLDLVVADTDAAAKEAQALAVRLGGYVGAVNAHRVDDVLHYAITLRIPVERLDEALQALKQLAVRIDREGQRVEDVTEQYVDLDARLHTLKATEAELQALLAESRKNARKVEEIMAVYRELVEIRSRIEQIQGQLLALEKLAALSTVNVNLRPTESARPVAGGGWRPSDTARGSVRTLLSLLKGLGDFLIFTIIVLVPLAVVLWLVWWLVVLLIGRLRARRPTTAPGPPPPAPPPAPSAGGS
jgi:chemotaxis protein histidine kinase CheA